MRILGTICARGGSKGVKNKNIRLLNGKPLISYSINALKAWGKANRIVCSTDSEDIKKIAIKYGAEVPFKRPAELATDTTDKLDVLKHLVLFCEKENKKYDYIIDLDATAPLRTIQDIENSFNKLLNIDAGLIYSVYKSEKNPYFNMVELDENGYAHLCKTPEKNIVARQQAPMVYSMNASIYIYRRDFLLETTNILEGRNIIYEMSDLSIDIDIQLDFDFIEYLLKNELYKFDY